MDLTIDEVGHYCTTSGLVNQNCGFDELTHFSADQFWYMLSRNRSMCGVKPRIRATTNPDATSWVRQLLAPWVDSSFPERLRADSGEIRWFYRDGGKIVWLRRRKDAPRDRQGECKSMSFVRASIYDNALFLAANPEYLANLKALPLVERKQLLDGDWEVKKSGNRFKQEWFKYCDRDEVPWQRLWPIVRRWDLAATEQDGDNDPDATAGIKIGRDTETGRFYVLDVQHDWLSSGDVEQLVVRTAERDGYEVQVRMEEEGGSSGKDQIRHYKLLLPGYDFRGVRSTGDKDTRARAFSAECQAGNVTLVRAYWNEPYVNELCAFPSKDTHDDQVDASSGAYNDIAIPPEDDVPGDVPGVILGARRRGA